MAITWSGWSNYLNARGENGWGMRFAYGYEISRRASDNHVLVNFYVAETTTNCYIYDAVRSVYASIWYSSNDKIGVSFSWGGSSTPLGTSNYNGGTIPNVGGTWPQTRQPVYGADAVYLHTYDVGNLDNAGTVTFTRDIDGGMGPYFGVSGSYNLDGYCQAPKISSVATPDRITTPPPVWVANSSGQYKRATNIYVYDSSGKPRKATSITVYDSSGKPKTKQIIT